MAAVSVQAPIGWLWEKTGRTWRFTGLKCGGVAQIATRRGGDALDMTVEHSLAIWFVLDKQIFAHPRKETADGPYLAWSSNRSLAAVSTSRVWASGTLVPPKAPPSSPAAPRDYVSSQMAQKPSLHSAVVWISSPTPVEEADGPKLDLEIDMATANDLRRGMAINYNGDVCVVLDSQHRTPGNLRAFVQATLRSIRSGRSSDVRFSSTEKIDVVPMMTRKMEFSYKDGEDYVFSDPETYETVTLSPEIVGDAKNYLVENGTITVTFVEDKAVSIELPSSVVLTVSDAPEGIRGDSANNVQKAVLLETGITVQAPLFIKTGEKIKVDTRTGKYMERA